MSSRSVFPPSVVWIAAAFAVAACHPGPTRPSADMLVSFTDDEEWQRFVDELPRSPYGSGCDDGSAELLYRLDAAAGDSAMTLSGTVLDLHGSPLEGVQVAAGDVGALTNQIGAFRLRIEGSPVTTRDTIELAATMIGYRVEYLDIPTGAGDLVQTTFRLCEQALTLDAVVVAEVAAPAADAVTNVQHAGVDEGGIVKLHGNHLVILRRGRLFTVDVGGDGLTPVDAINAYAPGIDPSSAWYDELLVSGDDVLVVGYSYQRGGTEIGRFRIDHDGDLTYLATYQLRSEDYYSSRNYASRLVDGKLVFYAPITVYGGADGIESLPAMRRWKDDDPDAGFEPITTATRIFRRADRPMPSWYVILHTVTTCALEPTELACRATAVVGSDSRVSYVSPTAAYVWVGPESEADASTLYRLPLDGAAPTAVTAGGVPIDQFSFREGTDLGLHVLVRSEGYGERMWGSEFGVGDLALLTLPSEMFSRTVPAVPTGAVRPLRRPSSGDVLHNRFVGDHLLYGTGTWSWNVEPRESSTLHVVSLDGGEQSEVRLFHDVDRIEVMGGDAVVVGRRDQDLHFTGVALDDGPRAAQRYVRRDAAQGETRSHGFFYRADGPATGVLGLPIRSGESWEYEYLKAGSASVLFLRNSGNDFDELGALGSDGPSDSDDGCVASCVDWYGNARPLFIGERVFALLGYEIVEGVEQADGIRERKRVRFGGR